MGLFLKPLILLFLYLKEYGHFFLLGLLLVYYVLGKANDVILFFIFLLFLIVMLDLIGKIMGVARWYAKSKSMEKSLK